MSIRRLLRLFFTALTGLCMLTLLTGCEEDVKLDPEFSLNLMTLGPKWPKVKKLTPSQKEVFEKYGKPDFLRIQWNSEGRVMERSELRQQYKGKQPKTLPSCFWVYESRGIEIFFDGSGYEERPLTDQVRLVIRHGDPEEVKLLAGGTTQWTFYGAGRTYRFAGGKIVEERSFPAMGRYLK